jgi:hypothetical protein
MSGSPEDTTKSEFGALPDVANSYYQPNQQKLSLSFETSRINRGISPNITIATKGTQTIAGIVNGDSTATA